MKTEYAIFSLTLQQVFPSLSLSLSLSLLFLHSFSENFEQFTQNHHSTTKIIILRLLMSSGMLFVFIFYNLIKFVLGSILLFHLGSCFVFLIISCIIFFFFFFFFFSVFRVKGCLNFYRLLHSGLPHSLPLS